MSNAGVEGSGHPVWIRSSYSNGAGGECVECASSGAEILVRDSKLGAGPKITLTGAAWRAFVGGVLAN
ncbi:DUF397 domain-containing protein [Streptomyces sp. NPDC047072]|uniref:DUF397 domain-containing protein n=1 Tax=Streptomyces sp. NPDC047072 TaxID=3154809 RepID=UPI0033D6C705